MKKPLHICLLSYRSNPSCGGQGIYIKELSRHLVDRGHQVDVISGEPYPHLDNRVHLIKLPGLNLLDQARFLPKQWWLLLTSFTALIEWFETVTGKFAEPKAFGKRVLKRFYEAHSNILYSNLILR